MNRQEKTEQENKSDKDRVIRKTVMKKTVPEQ